MEDRIGIEKDLVRIALEKYMDSNIKSDSWYARQMGISNLTLDSFLRNKRPTRPLTVRLIKKFLQDRGALSREQETE